MKVLVTGGNGQVGREIKEIRPDWLYVTREQQDLRDGDKVKEMLYTHKPNAVIHLAAKVGGIEDNIKYPADYISDNILIDTLMVKYSVENSVKQFIGILSPNIYPDTVDKYPMKEEVLHQGAPTATNMSYGIAKRAMAVHIDAVNKQYGRNYCYVTPCNLYGVYDKFGHRSHFMAALIKKIAENDTVVPLYGTGKPLRQFLYARDLAHVLVSMVEGDIHESFNIANPENISINAVAKLAIKAIGKDQRPVFDLSKPDGQYRKDMDIGKFRALFPDFKFTPLEEGIKEVYEKLFV